MKRIIQVKIPVLLLTILFLNCMMFESSILAAENPNAKDDNIQQNITLENITAISDGSNPFINPIWSPDGKKIAFNSVKVKELWIYELQIKELLKIPDIFIAGKFNWLNNSVHIVVKSVLRKNRPGFKYKLTSYSLKLINSRNKTIKDLHESISISSPHVTNNDVIWIKDYNSGQIKKYDNLGVEYPNTISDKIFYNNRKSNLVIYNDVDATEKIISDGHIWLHDISKDGSKVLVTESDAYGSMIKIYNTISGQFTDVIYGEQPKYSFDENYVIYQKTKDDGHILLGSDLFIADIDNKNETQLTFTENDFEFRPEWSPTSNQITFYEYNSGVIYIADVVIN